MQFFSRSGLQFTEQNVGVCITASNKCTKSANNRSNEKVGPTSQIHKALCQSANQPKTSITVAMATIAEMAIMEF